MPVLVPIRDGAISAGSLFSEYSGLLFEIHPPQRRFKWDAREVSQLWEDVRNAHVSNRDSYFLGTLLLADLGDGVQSVIDGQQRLTTLSLLLAVLRDKCREFEELTHRADVIQRLIARVDYDGNPIGPLVVKLQYADDEIYVRLVKEPGSTSGHISGKGLLEKAVRLLKERVENHINRPNPVESLRDLCQFVQDKVQFLPLQIPSEGEGYLVFDTTNTRGLKLSPAEGTKARLAAIAREDRNLSDELMQDWNKVATLLEERIEFSDPKVLAIDVMDDYLHAVWCSMNGYTTKYTMDKKIADWLTGARRGRELVSELTTYCHSYLAIRAPSGKSWTNEDLKDLRHLNRQSFSFLTMVYEHAPDRLGEAVSLTLSLQIRNITIGPQQAHAFEKQWPLWAGQVRDGLIEDVFRDMRSRMVPDEEFERNFLSAEVSSAPTARHLLRRLDPISRPGSGVQPMDVDLEHIMPKAVVTKLSGRKTLTKRVRQWIDDLGRRVPETPEGKQDLGEELKPHLNMLGNQALLNYVENRRARDLPFADKRVLYGNQALELTKALGKLEEWSLSQIQARQKDLAGRAIQTWPR